MDTALEAVTSQDSAVASPTDLPIYTNDQIANQLTHGYWNGRYRSWDIEPGGTITVNITNLSEGGQYLAREALKIWSMVTGIEFQEVASGSNITIQDTSSGAWCMTSLSGNTIRGARVNVSKSWLNSQGSEVGSYTFVAYIHEIGHALGLGHAGNYNGSAKYSEDGSGANHYLNDSRQATIMSYFSQASNTFVDADRAAVISPMMADIVAIQELYGVAENLQLGNTVYGYDSNAGGTYDLFATSGKSLTCTIVDSGGVDTLNFGQDSHDQIINLSDESVSSVLGKKGNLSIARGTQIENVKCGSGDDVVHGNNAANRIEGNAGDDYLVGFGGKDELIGGNGNDYLMGGKGADSLDGGAGRDRASYQGSEGGVIVDLADASNNTGEAMGDSYTSIEDIAGTAYNDELYGNEVDNRIWGSAGRDVIEGRGGNDVLYGGHGKDFLYGGDGQDSLFGHVGHDRLYGGAGNDVLRGGAGDDILTGGAGADEFHFRSGDGDDIIKDFENGADKIALHGLGWADLNISQSGADTRIECADNGTITIENCDVNIIGTEDFLFI